MFSPNHRPFIPLSLLAIAFASAGLLGLAGGKPADSVKAQGSTNSYVVDLLPAEVPECALGPNWTQRIYRNNVQRSAERDDGWTITLGRIYTNPTLGSVVFGGVIDASGRFTPDPTHPDAINVTANHGLNPETTCDGKSWWDTYQVEFTSVNSIVHLGQPFTAASSAVQFNVASASTMKMVKPTNQYVCFPMSPCHASWTDDVFPGGDWVLARWN